LAKSKNSSLLVKWCTSIVGEAELDAQLCAMFSVPGLQHFKKGIFFVFQWTGCEEMQKIFLGIPAGVVSLEVLQAVWVFLDFAYFAQYHSHTT
jgi:hypothetical protein